MTFGITLGNAIGRTAATLGHAACATANYTGQFGQDVMLGTVESYVTHSERLSAQRAAVARARERQVSIAVEVVASPARRAKATA